MTYKNVNKKKINIGNANKESGIFIFLVEAHYEIGKRNSCFKCSAFLLDWLPTSHTILTLGCRRIERFLPNNYWRECKGLGDNSNFAR